MQQTTPYSAERVSVALGLCIVMLASLPRFMAGGHSTRQTLIIMAVVFVAAAAIAQWRLLTSDSRRKLPRLGIRFALMLVIGAVIMGIWHAIFTTWISWQVFISHAATCGLLIHAVSLWWGHERRR
ncbi:MAG: hypothetical protein ACTIDY_04080 [Halomonadaceae bacterium]|uniref:hypothetical protein n=1 Tax=Halomonas TaxID=2745 RepID=UPI001CE3E756|nr:hypothetical protein [Halomonas colorata]